MTGYFLSPPFPPTSWVDVFNYDNEEATNGMLEFRQGDPQPGPNRSTSYRWGWQNAKRDRQGLDDGYDAIRHDYIRHTRVSR